MGPILPGYMVTHAAHLTGSPPGYVRNNWLKAYKSTAYWPINSLNKMASPAFLEDPMDLCTRIQWEGLLWRQECLETDKTWHESICKKDADSQRREWLMYVSFPKVEWLNRFWVWFLYWFSICSQHRVTLPGVAARRIKAQMFWNALTTTSKQTVIEWNTQLVIIAPDLLVPLMTGRWNW